MDLRENRLLGTISKWVNFSWFLAVAGMIIIPVVFLVFTFVPNAPISQSMTLDVSFFGANMATVLPAGSAEPTALRSIVLAVYGFAAIEAPATLVVLYQLKKILENVACKTPFVMENADRTRILGWTIVAGAILAAIRGMVLGNYLAGRIHVEGLGLTVRPPRFDQVQVIGIGFAVLLLAEVFSYGIRLQEEHDLTV